MGAEGTTTMAKKASAPKKAKAPLDHPPYVEMVKAALLALKERTGSSHYAIAKHIEEQQKVSLPPNFKKHLSVQLKKLVASGKLVKVKNSFKLAPDAAKKPATATGSKAKQSKVASGKTKAAPVKAKAKTAKPKAKVAEKAKKEKANAKPVKSAKSATAKSPARKVAAAKVKKAVEKAKKPKSIKSPAKKAPVAKKAKK